MHERKNALAISFWTSLIGVCLAAVAASVFLVCGRTEFVGWVVFAAMPVFFSLQISSITFGLIEHKSRSALLGLAVATASIGLVFGATYFKPARYIFSSLFAWPVFVAVPVISIAATAAATDVQNGRAKTLKPMLIVGALAFILVGWPVVGVLLNNPHSPLRDVPIALGLLLLGPWSVTGVVDHFDKSGFFFKLPLALVLTVAVASLAFMTLRAKNPRRSAILLIVFTAIVLCYFSVGGMGLVVWARLFR